MIRFLRSLLKAVIVCYAVAILGFVWLTKDLTFATLSRDPFFASYSIAVVIYVLGRFVLALFYRPVPDRGFRPTVSIIIPAFNGGGRDRGNDRLLHRRRLPGPPRRGPRHRRRFDRPHVVPHPGGQGPVAGAVRHRSRPQLRQAGRHGRGVRRARGDVLLFVDSDSYLDRDAVINIVQPFADQRVGAVVGHADVRNASVNWMTKMQQVRYYSAFRVIKGTESMLSGTVTCASGCCAAYRRSVVLPLLDEWAFQTFLGRPATFGDDRALTNRILNRHRVVYQASARAETMVPERPRVFFRQQLRWKKSWLRESMQVVRYFWRKNPIAAVFTYASIAFPFMAPWVVLHAVGGAAARGRAGRAVVLHHRHVRHGPPVLALLRLQAARRALVPRHDVRGPLHERPGVPDVLGHPDHARHPLGHACLHR